MKRLRVALLVVVVTSSAVAADVFVPAEPRRPAGARVSEPGGLLACPVGTIAGNRGVVYVANIGTADAAVRVTWIPPRGRAVVSSSSLAQGTARSFSSPAGLRRAGLAALVEFGGSEVVASHVASGKAGTGAARCAAPGPAIAAVPGMRTAGGEATLALFNPGSADAEVTVTLLADNKRLSPVRLTRRLIPGRTRADFQLAEFAFGASRLAALVTANAGRVVAEGFLMRPTATLVVSQHEPLQAPVLVMTRSSRNTGSFAVVAATGPDESAIDGRLIVARSQGRIAALPPLLRPFAFHALASPRAGPGAFAIRVQAGSPLTGHARWRLPEGDEASVEAVGTASRWGGVIGTSAPGRILAAVANPGDADAVARIRIFGAAQQVQTVSVPAGRIRTHAIAVAAGAVGFEIVSDNPVAVVLEVILAGTRRLALTLAPAPIYEPAPVSVDIDARAGIPAPF